jgi:putative inorganic carbon (HCO3(-)) transporter
VSAVGRTPWFPYVDLAVVAVAGGVWYAFPQAGAWPLILALAPWAGRYLLVRRLTRRTPFDLPLAIFVLTAGLSVWAAYDRQAAWPKFWLIVGGVLLFYALVNAEPIGAARLWFLALFGAAVALYFLATDDWDAYPAKIEAFTRLGRALQAPLPVLPGHRLHPNVAGGLMAMMLPFSGWVTLRTWRARWPWTPAHVLASIGSAASLALTAFGLLLTTSRGAWLALAAALLLAALWFLSALLSHGSPERRAWIFPALLALLLAVALAVGVAWPGGIPALVDAIPGPSTGLDRMQLLRNTFTLVRDYPLLGAGLAGFQMLYSSYVLLLHVGYTVHSHNLFLNVAVEQGLPALLALAWMALLFAVAVWRGLFRSSSRAASGALGVAALSFVILLFHGLVDDVLYGSRAVLLLFVPLAFAVPSLERQPRPRLAPRRALSLVPVALVLLMAAALIWRRPVLSLWYSNLGAVHQSQAELSVYSWPEWPIQDAVRRAVDLGRPVSEFERALAFDPHNATANRRLGMIELSLGEYGDALRHLEAASSAEPASETTCQLLGEALIVNGRVAEGQALWATLGAEQSQLAARVFWYQHIGDAERAAWVQQAAARR